MEEDLDIEERLDPALRLAFPRPYLDVTLQSGEPNPEFQVRPAFLDFLSQWKIMDMVNVWFVTNKTEGATAAPLALRQKTTHQWQPDSDRAQSEFAFEFESPGVRDGVAVSERGSQSSSSSEP